MQTTIQITDSFQRFKDFCQCVDKNLAGNLDISQSNLHLKLKVPSYRDLSQLFSSYENFFVKAKSSKSKKKSGTILIVWAACKFSELYRTPIDNFV